MENGRIIQACVLLFYSPLKLRIFMTLAMRPAAWNHVELRKFALKVDGISFLTLLLSVVL